MATKKTVDATEIDLGAMGGARDAEMDVRNGVQVEAVNVAGMTDKEFQKLMEDENFMNEDIVLVLHDTNDENALPAVSITVNERSVHIVRGQPTKLKRKYVEVLARARTTNYKQKPINPLQLDDSNRLLPKTGLSYPFMVTQDPSGDKGRAWLQNLLMQPG